MIDDFGYLNARVRALQGRLIGRLDLDLALAGASLEEFTAFLGSTAYGAAVAESLAATKGISGVEEGLRRDFQRTIEHIVRIAGGRPRHLLGLVLGRWELFNVKTVLRGLHAHVELERIMGSTVPFGRLDEAALKELARQGEVRGVLELLAQWRLPYAAALRGAYPVYRDRNDLHVLETAMDRAFFAAGLRSLDPDRPDDAVVSGQLRREIDVILIGYALRAMHHGVQPAEVGEAFIPGGRTITREAFGRLCATRTVAEFLAALPHSPYGACLAEQASRQIEPRRLFALDRALQSCFVRATMRLGAGAPLSIAFTIAYLWRKMNEITNLRLIARGKYAALPRAEIEALMIAEA